MPHTKEHEAHEEIRTINGKVVEAVKTTSSVTHVDMDTLDTSHTHTDIRAPLIHPAHATVSVEAVKGLAKEILGEGMTASFERVTAGAKGEEIYETKEQQEKLHKHQEKYYRDMEAIRDKHERDMAKLTEEYRKKTEHEAEKIRKEMEKQHERDIDFRQKMVEDVSFTTSRHC